MDKWFDARVVLFAEHQILSEPLDKWTRNSGGNILRSEIVLCFVWGTISVEIRLELVEIQRPQVTSSRMTGNGSDF